MSRFNSSIVVFRGSSSTSIYIDYEDEERMLTSGFIHFLSFLNILKIEPGFIFCSKREVHKIFIGSFDLPNKKTVSTKEK